MLIAASQKFMAFKHLLINELKLCSKREKKKVWKLAIGMQSHVVITVQANRNKVKKMTAAAQHKFSSFFSPSLDIRIEFIVLRFISILFLLFFVLVCVVVKWSTFMMLQLFNERKERKKKHWFVADLNCTYFPSQIYVCIPNWVKAMLFKSNCYFLVTNCFSSPFFSKAFMKREKNTPNAWGLFRDNKEHAHLISALKWCKNR